MKKKLFLAGKVFQVKNVGRYKLTDGYIWDVNNDCLYCLIETIYSFGVECEKEVFDMTINYVLMFNKCKFEE